ncbi:MAG: hypothetical protein FWD59_03390 [Micrococcales bacterium]|nr:hypothetical protein [Micrococcales bacterium]
MEDTWDRCPSRVPELALPAAVVARRGRVDGLSELAACLGHRVTVRRRLAEGGYSDALGELVSVDSGAVIVRTRRGEVSVPVAEIAIARVVLPRN